jgi:hypothetical protein
MRGGSMAVGRFQVMATLQAARAYVLGMPVASAKSFGIQRAIFYAAAKRGFRGTGERTRPREITIKYETISQKELSKIQKSFAVTPIYFVIGNEIKTSADFRQQIEKRFGASFRDAWKEAVAICRKYDKGVLLSQRYFYETVYKTRRDELAKKWSRQAAPG